MAIHDDHIDPREALSAFLEYGGASAEHAFRYHLHLIGKCTVCTRRLLNHVGLASLEEVAAVPSPAVELPALAAGVELAPLMGWLWTQPRPERFRAVREEARFQRPAMVTQLLQRSQVLWATDPEEAHHWSELALELLVQIPEYPLQDFFAGSMEDLRALAWAYRGTAARLQGELELAGYCFGRASEAPGLHSLDELVTAEVLRLHSAVLRAQRRFKEAAETIEEAVELYGCACRWHEQGRALLVQAKLRYALGDREEALRDLDRAEPALESDGDAQAPALRFAAGLLRLRILWLSGRYAEAMVCLPEVLARDVEGALARLQLLRIEAAILVGLGREQEAVPVYRLARDGYRNRGCPYELALVTVELTRIWLGRAVRVSQ